MRNDIFREKNIDRVTSPEQLNDYIQVTSAGIWSVLIAIILLLSGVFVWAIFGKLDTTITVGAVCTNGRLTCYVEEADILKIQSGMTIIIDDNSCTIDSVSSRPVQLIDEDAYLLHIGNLNREEWAYPVSADLQLADGIYKADIKIESVSPISFILN